MRTVFDNAQVAHVWAAQSQPEGRSHNGNFWFDGRDIYSYRTKVARIVANPKGEPVALVTTRRYSVTTSGKHMNPIRQACRGRMPTLYVDAIHAAPEEMLAGLVSGYNEYIAKKTRRPTYYSAASRLEDMVAQIKLCADTFGLPAPEVQDHIEAAAIRAAYEAREARMCSLEAQAKRERERERRAARKAEKDRVAQLRAEEKVAAWVRGELAACPWLDGPARLRVHGNELQTSQGARVPLEHAKRAFAVAARVRAVGTAWEPNGHTLHVGAFSVDRIDADGTIKAGCHTIAWAEAERIARELGIVEA